MPEHHTEERSLRKALAVYASLFILQLGGYAATGVLVLLAEAYHTLSDVLVSSFLLYALAWSRKPSDQSFYIDSTRISNRRDASWFTTS